MCFGRSKPPKPPDMRPIAEAQLEAARISERISREQMEFAREQYEYDKAIMEQFLGIALPEYEEQVAFAASERNRYRDLFLPLENAFVEFAEGYASPERQQAEAARAIGDVRSSMENARQRALADLEAFGIDPSMTRGRALDLGTRVAEGAMAAQAAEGATRQVRDRGEALQMEAINLGRGVPILSNQTAGLANQTGQGAVGSNMANTGNFMNSLGNPLAWAQNQLQGIGGAGETMNQGYRNQLAHWQASQEARSGFGSFLGGLGSIAGAAFGSPWVGGLLGLNEGGPVPERPGPSAVPHPEDTVPAMLTPGEYVIPDDVVLRKGTEFFDKLIEKSRAIPDDGGPPDQGGGPPMAIPGMPPPNLRTQPPRNRGFAIPPQPDMRGGRPQGVM